MATMCFESMSGCDFPHDYEDSFADTLKMPPLDESLLLNDNDMVGFEDLVFVGRKEQSIRGDVAKIAADHSSWMLDDLHDIMDDIKPDLRNGDCMWSSFGSANTCHNNSSNNGCNGASNSACNGGNSAASSYSESSAVPPAIVSCSGTMMIKHEMTEDDEDDVVDEHDNHDDDEEENCNSSNSSNNSNNNSNNTSSNICSNKLTTFATSARITIRPNKSATTMRYNNNTTSYNNNVEQHIPPGASLLRKSNPSTAVSTALKLKQQYHSINRRSSQKESMFLFPDPPYQNNNKEDASMAPVFRHNVDLAACLVGSNNISLTSSSEPSYHIDHISRELQNGKSRFDLYHSNYQPQISDVLDVISQQVTADAAAISASSSSSSGSSASAATTSTTMSPPASNSDCDSDDGDCSMVDSNCGSSSYMRHISDHSYTRSEMETNLETPSDSDEEIDVVSLNDKTLPTNPSDRDRRALQTKVANKISTIPPPRRGRYELPYTPASSSPVKSEANSRFPSPSSTPYQNSGAAVATVYSPLLLRNTSSGSSSSSSSSSAGSDCATSTMLWEGSSSSGSINNKSSRKRYQDTCRSSGAFSKQLQASKKSRAKLSNNSVLSTAHPGAQLKQQQHTLGANSSSSSSASSNSANSSNVNFSVMKRQFSLDEADTIEKRNLHNDMERQRRIGLKNLFEALKKQIPNIRDKERAPKVNILREAAKLCDQLTNEERELSLKRQLLKAQLKQRQEKIARLRLSMNAAE